MPTEPRATRWFEVWADPQLDPPYVVLVRPAPVGPGVEILDPREGNAVIYRARDYNDADIWRCDEEYVRVSGRTYVDAHGLPIDDDEDEDEDDDNDDDAPVGSPYAARLARTSASWLDAPMARSFEARGLRFRPDREGVDVPGPRCPVAEAIEPHEAGFGEGATLAEQLGARLSTLFGLAITDDEGIYDVVVERAGAVVAAVQVSCDDDDDVIEVLGERAESIGAGELASALAEALRG
jgi:hypothetical protein